MRTKELFAFIKERHAVYVRRRQGKSKPWTRDPILQQYRFCNVYRELDVVTEWIRNHWRDPHHKDPDLWFAMLVARKVNFPESLAEIGYPSPWNPRKFVSVLKRRADEGKQCESAAYMITAGVGPDWKGVPKREFLARAVFTPLWAKRAAVRPKDGDTLAAFHVRLSDAGMTVGSFIAGQVVADTKFHGILKSASDWWTFAAPGPGSQRGLNRVLGFPVKQPWNAEDWCTRLAELQLEIDKLVKKADMPRLSAQDLQNCLCEYSKYEKARTGEGRPKQLYAGV